MSKEKTPKNEKLPRPPLLLITDRKLCKRDLRHTVSEAFEAGCRWLMIREKDLTNEALEDLVRELVKLATRFGATALVNSNPKVAARCNADGVHLPHGYSVAEARRLLRRDSLVGVSTHSIPEALRAYGDGADYVTLSPIFRSVSKPSYGPDQSIGLEMLHEVANKVSIPVIALGGILPDKMTSCFSAGAKGVAILGSVMNSDDPRTTVREYLDRMTST